MKLFEYEAKRILRQYGIAFPAGQVAHSVEEAGVVAAKIGKPVAVKAQVLVSGRGKAGGILFADDAVQARETAARLIGSKIKDILVHSVLIEEMVDTASQMYTSIAVDRQHQSYVVLVSLSGGVNIEQIAKEHPERIIRYIVNYEKGFDETEAKRIVQTLDLPTEDKDTIASILTIMYKVLISYDAELVELNPLVKLTTGRLSPPMRE
jgi:succinyl-CoA synthetase beta subunit